MPIPSAATFAAGRVLYLDPSAEYHHRPIPVTRVHVARNVYMQMGNLPRLDTRPRLPPPPPSSSSFICIKITLSRWRSIKPLDACKRARSEKDPDRWCFIYRGLRFTKKEESRIERKRRLKRSRGGWPICFQPLFNPPPFSVGSVTTHRKLTAFGR